MNNPWINVSGIPTVNQNFIRFPSGVFNITLDAYLASLNATFGFNSSSHRFELEYIPARFDYTVLPHIGSGVSFYIGDFYIAGRIKHADYSKSKGGKVLSVAIEDVRTDLNDVYLDTYGIFGSQDAPSNNLVDVRYWYLKVYAETRAVGRSRVIRDLETLETQGASYRQIYDAIKFFEEDQGTIIDIIRKIPPPEVVEAQLPLDPDGYRWRFRSQPLLEVLTKILDDVAYDFYWDMFDEKIDVINRRHAINISESAIPIAGDPAPIISSRYGIDEGERPNAVRIYGSEMEGLVGSGIMMTQSGAYELDISQYDLGIEVGKTDFFKGWTAKLKYFGPDGNLNEYTPDDKELSMALKSIEYWALYKGLDNRIGNFTIDPDTGLTIAQQSVTGSGIGLLQNRRQDGRSWIVEWYNRVRGHAQNHYGRTYVLSPSSMLYQHIDNIDIIPAAWCNLENLTDDGSFIDNYQIKQKYKFLSPFWDFDNNRLRPFAVMSGGTKWGIDGEGVPASFTEFNEDPDANVQFVPIETWKWDVDRRKFQEEFLSAFEDQEKGIAIRLPNIAWDHAAIEDDSLKTVHRLISFNQIFNQPTTIDVPNPFKVIQVYQRLDNVAIPIKVKRRYGYAFPDVWASGIGPAVEIQIREELAPWNYEPRGTKTSVDQMDEEAKSSLVARIVDRDTVTFAEATKVGLPVISFDNFADQAQQIGGFGIVSHGVTSLNLVKNVENWWQTKYNIKSHFPDFIKIQPVKKTVGEKFAFILHRLDEDTRRRPDIPRFLVPNFIDLQTDDGRRSIKSDSGIEHEVERLVTIIRVFDRGANEFYLGMDEQGIRWPRALEQGFGNSGLQIAHCIDGFLQVGMQAKYHLEKRPDGSVSHYFVGGVPLDATRIVELVTSPELLNGIYVSTVRTLPTVIIDPVTQIPAAITPFSFFNLPYLDQENVNLSLEPGDKQPISSHGNKKILVPDGDYGPGSDGDGDAFIVNTGGSGAGLSFPVFVTTKPSAVTGRGGVVKSVDPAGGITYTDGGTISNQVYNVFFIGTEPGNIELNDYGIAFKMQEVDESADFRLFVFIVKPLLSSSDSFGG